jgi:hypothetical protein
MTPIYYKYTQEYNIGMTDAEKPGVPVHSEPRLPSSYNPGPGDKYRTVTDFITGNNTIEQAQAAHAQWLKEQQTTAQNPSVPQTEQH